MSNNSNHKMTKNTHQLVDLMNSFQILDGIWKMAITTSAATATTTATTQESHKAPRPSSTIITTTFLVIYSIFSPNGCLSFLQVSNMHLCRITI
ncbi:hypothetical protein Hanom_Chr07g00670041 [Helianthus anomalus]